ncbi:hypothetical protein PIB30_091580 [Stylosanthes scabra]|uniref:Cation/H+ exchanger domain-containing protein n=1 Tax=Stylosanthes scabra TaxID=79078 RepID=A0ABU6TU11_9FABA|nr:hypothetical protein [Stylosanthes scabra]
MAAINQTIFKEVRVVESRPESAIYEICLHMPPRIVSDGIWADEKTSQSPLESSLTLLEMQILVIFGLMHCFHFVLKRFGFPYFVSQLLVGFVLGPSLNIDWLNKYKMKMFPYGTEDILGLISLFGYTFYLFLNSVQMDFSMITRSGMKPWAMAVAAVVGPLAICLIITCVTRNVWKEVADQTLSLVVITQAGCSFVVIASCLSELDILNSELGRIALTTALSSDFLTAVMNSLSIVFTKTQAEKHDAGQVIKGMTVYAAILILVPLIGRPTMKWVAKNTPEGRPVRKIYTFVMVLSALIIGCFAIRANLPIIFGIVMLGFVVPEGPPLGSELVKQFELINVWFFVPLFVTSAAMKVDLNTIGDDPSMALATTGVILMVHLIKIFLCTLICIYCKIPTRDTICLGLILCCKGVVDISLYLFMYESGTLNSATVATLFISALILGSTAYIGIKSLYDPSRKYAGFEKRNILHLKPNSDLRIVACIQKPHHVSSIKNMLYLCPTSTSPLEVEVLHLIELVGSATPIFISHQLQESASTSHNYSGDIMVAFDLFKHDNASKVKVNTYTAISPQRLMYEDICHLALDKVASLILLPFHIRWADDGSVDSTEESIRTLNNKVLEKAPCSVGILVNKGPCDNASKNIAMIFLGGSDDREALCLAKRAITESHYKMVVYHLVGTKNESTNWDIMLDEEMLKSVKGVYGTVNNVAYERMVIEDPSQTQKFIQTIAAVHDYIIVGRRHGVKSSLTTALENWTEFSELGAIGDLLASPDTNSKASILVVQQQKITQPKS